MSSEPPPGCDLKCLIKWFEDNQGNAADLKQSADFVERLYWHLMKFQSQIPEYAGLIAEMPDLIKEERIIHGLVKSHRAHLRRALQYKGQGLPASELKDYQP